MSSQNVSLRHVGESVQTKYSIVSPYIRIFCMSLLFGRYLLFFAPAPLFFVLYQLGPFQTLLFSFLAGLGLTSSLGADGSTQVPYGTRDFQSPIYADEV